MGEFNPEHQPKQEKITHLKEGDVTVLETREISKEEILAQLEAFEGVKAEDLEAMERTLSHEGVLVALYCRVKEEKAQELFKCSSGYAYLIKVEKGSKVGSLTTVIERVDLDKNGEVDYAREIAELVNDAWVKKG